jgi:hypothetical protein
MRGCCRQGTGTPPYRHSLSSSGALVNISGDLSGLASGTFSDFKEDGDYVVSGQVFAFTCTLISRLLRFAQLMAFYLLEWIGGILHQSIGEMFIKLQSG